MSQPGQPGAGLQGVRRAARCSPRCRSAWRRASGSASSVATATARRRCSQVMTGPGAARQRAGRRVARAARSATSTRATPWTTPTRSATPYSAGRPDHAWAAEPRTREIVTELLAGVELDRAVVGLSGGERRRCALAELLLHEHDLVVLDEPTNHLDVEAVAWLAEHLVVAAVRAGRGHPRPVVPRRGVPADLGGPRRRGRHLRGRVRRVRARQGGAAAAGGGVGGTPAQPGPQGARLAAPRAARRARRSRSSGSTPPTALIDDEPPPRDRLELQRFATQRLGKDVIDVEDVDLVARRPDAAVARHLAARPGRPGRHRRRQRRRQVVGARPARRHAGARPPAG